jgi:competence protein ComEA
MSGPTYRIAAIGLLALLAVLFITAAAILLARGDGNAPIQIITPSSEGAADSERENATATSPSSVMPPDLQVYIHGAVQSPGVYPLQPGDRLVDAVAAAGGAVAEADLKAVNLAQRVQDEGYYYVPREGETPPAIAVSPGVPTSPLSSDILTNTDPGNGLIDLNTASVDALITLPGIGPARAQAIVDYREQNGTFVSVEQVTEVSGIGPATYESIRGLVTVSVPSN